jgi:Ca2+-transporting ATPase
MQRPPRDPKRPIVADRDWAEIVGHGLAITAATLVAAEIARSWLSAGPDAAVTVSFLTLALAQLWHAFNMADGNRRAGFDWSVVRSPYVWGAIALCIGILLAAMHIAPIGQVLRLEPPTFAVWGVILGMSLAPLALAALWRQASRAMRSGRLRKA